MENVKGIIGVIITDRIDSSNIMIKIGEMSAIGLILEFLEKKTDKIYDKYGIDKSFLEIFIVEDKKYVICSFGYTMITTIAEISTTDIELKVYSVHLADKIESIKMGNQEISSEIPGILKLFSKSEGGIIPKGHFSLKIVFIGDNKSGKSSIIKKFVEDIFFEDLKPTIGFEVHKKDIEISENTKINYLIWDTGGFICQINPTKEKIYNFADAVIIVIDITQNNYYKSIKRWYDEINESVLYEIPILIIGSKIDLIDKPFIKEKELKKNAEKFGIPYILSSAKTGYNIREIFIEIADNIIGLLEENKKNQEIHITNEKYNNCIFNVEEIKALEDLEHIILNKLKTSVLVRFTHDIDKFKKRGFPQIFNISETSFGIKVSNGRVTGIGLFNCGLTKLPKSFEKLKSLKKLSLRCNPLSAFPDEISKLENLEDLDLALTRLMMIPASIGNLKSLKTLHIENNILNTLPEDFGKLKLLEVLYLDNNPLKKLPYFFSVLENLKELHMEAPKYFYKATLSELPEYFGNLKSLTILDFDSHELKILPESFGNLKSLRKLNLYGNKIKILPESFGNLQNLEILNLENNNLKYLPDSLGNLVNLKKVNLTHNFLSKEGSKKFKALAFKTSGKEYDRLMNLSEMCKLEEEIKYRDVKRTRRRNKKNIFGMLAYATIIALIGFFTFNFFIDFTSNPSFFPIIWLIFVIALLINLFIGASIIPTISSYIKITVVVFQKKIYKIFDIFVVILLIWAIRSVVKTTLTVELIPAVNFLFEYSIPDELLNVLVNLGYNIELTFLENIDLFFGHFFLKIFGTGLVFWSLYRNGIGHIKKTAFDEKEKRNIWQFLIFGIIGAFSLAIMDYSTLKETTNISYSIGVCIGACIFIYVKHNENLRIFIQYIFTIGSGITIVWITSLIDILMSLICGIVFIIIFIFLRWRVIKKHI